MDYGKALEVSSGSSDNESVFRDGPSFGNGTSLQLQLQEYALKCPGRRKEGGAILSRCPGNRTPPVAMN